MTDELLQSREYDFECLPPCQLEMEKQQAQRKNVYMYKDIHGSVTESKLQLKEKI